MHLLLLKLIICMHIKYNVTKLKYSYQIEYNILNFT